jgi:hypothetical protein
MCFRGLNFKVSQNFSSEKYEIIAFNSMSIWLIIITLKIATFQKYFQ